MLSAVRRHNINGKLEMKHIVWSSQLRATGLTGFGGEEGIMAYALNTHFQCTGPEGWHFVARRVKRHKRIAAAEIHNEIRLLSKPAWFHTYLHDLIGSRKLVLCKTLPRPEEAIISKSERASCWQHLTKTAKRKHIADKAEEQYNPKMMQNDLWKQLNISMFSLPSSLRPGKHAR